MTHQIEWQESAVFPSVVYTLECPEFLNSVAKVCAEALKESEALHPKLDEIYPVRMSKDLSNDHRLAEFTEYVGVAAWNILSSQGYDVANAGISVLEFWCQEHHKHSLMEQHVHGRNAQLVGFYFLETPENCSKLVVHDPRVAKMQIDLPQVSMLQVSTSSSIINYDPAPGRLIITNAWLPHSFSRHAAEQPIKFIHFNLGVQYQQPQTSQTLNVEIV